jgi:hypothetical protein
MKTYLRFGQYLHDKGLIDAYHTGAENNLRIGELTKAKGWLTEDDVLKILVIQEETKEKYGEIAVRENYLTQDQVDQLLREQADSYIYFGEALVKLGIITQDVLINHLKEFNKIKPQATDQ